MKKPLFRLLYTVKMIFDVSTFYNSPERVNFLSWFFSYENLLKGRLSHCEDHKPSDPKLQALHHGERQPHHLGASKIT